MEPLRAGGYEFSTVVTEIRDIRTQRVHTYGLSVGLIMGAGGRPRPCVSISVTAEHDDERLRHALPADVAALNQVEYAPCCSLGKPLHRGGGTGVMVRAACRLALRMYPWVRAFKLTDTSHVDCGGRAVPLAELSLCCYGMTWYERVFGAQLADAARHQAYRLLVDQQLLAPDAKPSSFAAFCTEAAVPEDLWQVVRPAYDSQASLTAFFAALRDQLSGEPFCAVFGGWGGAFIANRLRGLHRGEWLIRAEALGVDLEAEAGAAADEKVRGGVGLSWCCGRPVLWEPAAMPTLPIEEL